MDNFETVIKDVDSNEDEKDIYFIQNGEVVNLIRVSIDEDEFSRERVEDIISEFDSGLNGLLVFKNYSKDILRKFEIDRHKMTISIKGRHVYLNIVLKTGDSFRRLLENLLEVHDSRDRYDEERDNIL